jgi:hypothetical protein
MTPPGWSVGIVVPACNEETTVEACIVSIRGALAACADVASSWIVVVADSCVDSTVELATAALGEGGTVIECSVASPGRARRRGANEVLRHFTTHSEEHIWIANTDADSQPRIPTGSCDNFSWQTNVHRRTGPLRQGDRTATSGI